MQSKDELFIYIFAKFSRSPFKTSSHKQISFKSTLLGGEMVPTCFSSSPFTVFVFLISDESQNQTNLPDKVPERSRVHFLPKK